MKYLMNIEEYFSHLYDEQHSVNEGFLSDLKSLFGNIKSLFVSDWKSVKCKYPDVRKDLEQADNELTGFTLCKMRNPKGASIIRQELCNYMDTLVDSKLNDLENNKKIDKIVMDLGEKDKIGKDDIDFIKNAVTVNDLMKRYGIKDRSYAETIKDAQENIEAESKNDPELGRWARTLMGRIRSIVNNNIIKKYDGDKKKELKDRLKKQSAEEKKIQDEINKKKEKANADKVSALEKERDGVISKSGARTMNMSGDKAVREIGSSIDGMVKESFEKGSAIKKRMETRGIYLGFEEIVDILDKKVEKSDEVAKLIVNELDKIYEVIEAKSKELANLPGENIQAMMIGISRALTYAITGEKDVLDDNTIELLARCAIDSDRTIGYGIPLYDVKKPKDGNIFCVILQTLKDAKDEAGLFDKETLEDMKKRMGELYKVIIDKAKKLKKAADKEAEKDEKN